MKTKILAIVGSVLFGCPVGLVAEASTAAEIFTRIQQSYGAAITADTVDTLKAGDPTTKVTGIATTFLDTMDVLREAVRRGDNLLISHEPTFYNHRDDRSKLLADPVFQEKLAFIEAHHLAIYRLHDQIHAAQTDHILDGLYDALGWTDFPHPKIPDGEHYVTIPQTTLLNLSQFLQFKLHIDTLRVEGDPSLVVDHVAVEPGAAGLLEHVKALERPEVSVLIAGEASEWETVEYVRDALAQGRPQGLILLGHEASEEPGMEKCAKDLRALFPGLRVDYLPAGQPLSLPQTLTRKQR